MSVVENPIFNMDTPKHAIFHAVTKTALLFCIIFMRYLLKFAEV